MNRPLGNGRLGDTTRNDPSIDPAEQDAGRLPPHLAVLAITGLSIVAWAVVGLLAQPILRAL